MQSLLFVTNNSLYISERTVLRTDVNVWSNYIVDRHQTGNCWEWRKDEVKWMFSALAADSKDTRSHKLHQLPFHGTMYFLSTPPCHPLLLAQYGGMVLERIWDVLVCPKRMHTSRTNVAGESKVHLANPGSPGRMAIKPVYCKIGRPKGTEICIARHHRKKLTLKCSVMDHTVFTLQKPHACLYLRRHQW